MEFSNLTYKPKAIDWAGEGLRQVTFFPLMRGIVPLQVEGITNLQDEAAFIFAPNHSSHLDTLVLLQALPLHLRLRVRVAAAADYFFSNAFKGGLVRLLLNAFPFVRKGEERFRSLGVAEALLYSGHSIVLYPEGTRSVNGEIQPFKRGIGQLALNSKVKVVPTYIDGTYQSMPKGAKLPARQPITVRFGTPRQFAPNQDPLQVAALIQKAVSDLRCAPNALSARNEA